MTEKRERGGAGASSTRSPTGAGRRSRSGAREPASELAELREQALLKLFFGADPAALAAAQIPANRAKLAEYEAIRDSMPDDVPAGPRQALEVGIRIERERIAFWEELEDG